MSNIAPETAGLEPLEDDVYPGARKYLVIGAILAVLTAAEVAAYYIEAFAPVLVYILVVLTAAKFLLVVGYYMHLKFDNRIFSVVFFAPFTLAFGMIIALVILFKVLNYM